MKKKSIVGLTNKMRNGMQATVIADRGTNDIDVKFEDGTIVRNRKRSEFSSGTIANPALGKMYCKTVSGSLTGQTKIMNNGMQATVIADRGSIDIDIEFEDGTIVRNKRRSAFNLGNISNPTLGKMHSKTVSNSIIGQTKIMNNGMLATVIADRGKNDIDIQFEDGTVVKKTRRVRFNSGNIANPTLGKMYRKIVANSLVGQTKIMNNGMQATVVADHGRNDIDVEFEDGTIVYHRRRGSFQKGELAHYTPQKSIVGQSNTMRNGMVATVIADRGIKDIDVQFADGTIVNGRTRGDFRNGSIRNPSLQGKSKPQAIVYYFIKLFFPDAILDYRPDWLKNPTTNYNLELDIWIPSIQIGIEYDGCISSHKQKTDLGNLKRDLILSSAEIKQLFIIHEKGTYEYLSDKYIHYWLSHTSYDKSYDLYEDLEIVLSQILDKLGISTEVEINSDVIEKICVSYIGEKNIMNNGLEATIIAFRSYDDLDVRFEDGTVIKNRDVTSFKTGSIALPSWHSAVGEQNTMNNGMVATVIRDRGTNDIDIRFEDGTIVKTTRSKFRSGRTQKPRDSLVGSTNIMRCGFKATVITDNGVNDLDIEFEDGTVVKHRAKKEFLKGNIAHPSYRLIKEDFIGQKKKMHNGMYATVIAYRDFKDIDVQFEDGTVVEHTRRDQFNSGYIKNPNLKKNK